MGAMALPAGFHTTSGVSVETGVSVTDGVIVGSGVFVADGVKVGAGVWVVVLVGVDWITSAVVVITKIVGAFTGVVCDGCGMLAGSRILPLNPAILKQPANTIAVKKNKTHPYNLGIIAILLPILMI